MYYTSISTYSGHSVSTYLPAHCRGWTGSRHGKSSTCHRHRSQAQTSRCSNFDCSVAKTEKYIHDLKIEFLLFLDILHNLHNISKIKFLMLIIKKLVRTTRLSQTFNPSTCRGKMFFQH